MKKGELTYTRVIGHCSQLNDAEANSVAEKLAEAINQHNRTVNVTVPEARAYITRVLPQPDDRQSWELTPQRAETITAEIRNLDKLTRAELGRSVAEVFDEPAEVMVDFFETALPEFGRAAASQPSQQ